MYNKIMAIFFFIKGKDRLSHSDDLTALEYLKKATSYKKKYDIYTYKGLAEFNLNDYENSILSYQFALQLLESDKKLNLDEKNYLFKFILEDLIKALKILNINNNLREYEKKLNELVFNTKNIRKSFFDDFPLVYEKRRNRK